MAQVFIHFLKPRTQESCLTLFLPHLQHLFNHQAVFILFLKHVFKIPIFHHRRHSAEATIVSHSSDYRQPYWKSLLNIASKPWMSVPAHSLPLPGIVPSLPETSHTILFQSLSPSVLLPGHTVAWLRGPHLYAMCHHWIFRRFVLLVLFNSCLSLPQNFKL